MRQGDGVGCRQDEEQENPFLRCMPEIVTNLEVLRRSRKPPRAGDVFAYRMRGHRFGFGRVIATRTKIGGWENVIMIYIYNVFSEEMQHDLPLSRERLLLPPLGTDRTPWTRGYFATIGNATLSRADVLARHCFFSDAHERYFDENGKIRRTRVDPCGSWDLRNCYALDDAISAALGVPYAQRNQ